MQRYYFFLIPPNLNPKKKQPISGLPHIKLSTVSYNNLIGHFITTFFPLIMLIPFRGFDSC